MRNGMPKLSPITVVCATALIVVGASTVTNYFLGARSVDARVREVTELSSGVKLSEESRRKQIVTAMDGEVARTAERLSEASALTIAASLYAATEQARGRTPRTVSDLLAGLAAQGLMPPGIRLGQAEGTLVSVRGNLFMRYRPQPLAIEVLSVGHERIDGPALIVRVPDESAGNSPASIFVATSLSDVRLPSAFAPAAEIIALGWSPEPMRSLK